ncbi:MAG TPA: phage Gp37/Gp68 family protein [Urbifossiella sp.]|nr:phage Gp37/Gp68 family protein [Urbifossiella sp.]
MSYPGSDAVAANSAIEWTTHTFNPWEGCSKVSPGCAHCYAESRAGRYGSSKWGPNGTRVVRSEAYWRGPLKWNREAAWCGNPVCKAAAMGRAGGRCACGLAVERPRVFVASLADVFEDWQGKMVDARGERLYYPMNSWEDRRPWVPISECGGEEKPITMGTVRKRLFDLIDATLNLDWLLLTKRPQNIWDLTPGTGWVDAEHRAWPVRENVWFGTSVENQAAADERIPHLMKVPAAVRFLSMEPLLGPVDLGSWYTIAEFRRLIAEDVARGHYDPERLRLIQDPHTFETIGSEEELLPGLHWVIAGGESGHGARPMHPLWARQVRDQCQAAGVPFFFKQWGEWGPGARCDHPKADYYWFQPDGTLVSRFGKKAAGRLLDGQEFSGFPTTGVA